MQAVAFKLFFLSLMLLGLPLIGLSLSGRDVVRYLEFPPLTQYVSHAPFSWLAFGLFGTAIIAMLAAVVVLSIPRGPIAARPFVSAPRRFPWWGWLAAILLCVSWLLAWTRFAWFRPLQTHTFIPLWLSYIVLANALALRRTGRCLLTERTGYFLSLFPLSALFWWYFEYLNRFVQNWYYVGIEDFGAIRYTVHATLAFSTVLPAVIGTTQWLQSYPTLGVASYRLKLPRFHTKIAAIVLLLVAAAGLAGIGVWPDYLFPMLWVAPLLLIVSLQLLLGEDTLFSPLSHGHWRPVLLPALAALQCGFLWELWNHHSQAKWIYTIPLVQRFEIFEMPLLGYAGYLAFGLECAAIAALADSDQSRSVAEFT